MEHSVIPIGPALFGWDRPFVALNMVNRESCDKSVRNRQDYV